MINRIKEIYKEHSIDKEKIRLNVIKQAEESNRVLKFRPVFAACIAILVLAIGFSGYEIAVEVKAYNKALMFFENYNLPKDGLTKSDIKTIYSDISAGKFTYEKTAKVIIDSIGRQEIFQEEPTPEDLYNLWNYKKNGYIRELYPSVDGITYLFNHVMRHDSDLGIDLYEKSVFSKYIDSKEVWHVELDNFIVENYITAGSSVFVYGYTPTWSSAQKSYACAALLNIDGGVEWYKTMSNGFNSEYIGAVVYDNNEFTVFSRGDLKYLCFSKFDMCGNLKSFSKNEVGNYGIFNAAKLGDGYIVQLGNFSTTSNYLVKVDSEGLFTDKFTYTADDDVYYIKDMIEFGGNVYLSAYSVPKLDKGESDAGGRYEIAAILNYIFDNEKTDIKSEELTKLLRDNYTAVLLVCNPKTGVPHDFYSVKGSLGGELSLNEDGMLYWKVESITDTYLSLLTSSFTIGGASKIYRYTFDKDGKIISQEKTNEVANFRR